MAALILRLWWVAAVLLLWSPRTQCREFTHEDIRDAMLSIVHMMRLSEDKLERHEYREKGLGEQLKRMLTNLDRKHRDLEPLKGMISRLDERLSNVETILLHKEEREKSTQKKTNEALEGIKKSIQTLTITIENLKPSKAPEIDNNLTTNEDSIDRRLDVTDSKIEDVKIQMETLKKNLNKDTLRSVFVEAASDINPFEKHLTDAEKLLTKYELKLNEYNGTKVPTDIVQLSEVALADEAWHSKMTEEMERQGKEITKIQKLLSDAEGVWKQLPQLTDLHDGTNQTLEAVGKVAASVKENSEDAVNKVTTKLRELSDRLASTNEDIQQSLTQGNTLSERAYADIARSYESLHAEVQSLIKSEKVMLQTADNVIANKKRIEYGVHQILMQVSELILKQGRTLNYTINERLDSIEASIMGNQALSQVNLSSKIETEMSQVWRQIGVMHEQLKASNAALDKLNELSNQYVNSSTTTLGKVKTDVDSISKRMLKLGDDFNYALGRLGLVTQEFSQISTGLANAIGSLKMDVQAVQAKADSGPGPHKIPSTDKTP